MMTIGEMNKVKDAEKHSEWIKEHIIQPTRPPIKPSKVINIINKEENETDKLVAVETSPENEDDVLDLDSIFSLYSKNYKILTTEEKAILLTNFTALCKLSEDIPKYIAEIEDNNKKVQELEQKYDELNKKKNIVSNKTEILKQMDDIDTELRKYKNLEFSNKLLKQSGNKSYKAAIKIISDILKNYENRIPEFIPKSNQMNTDTTSLFEELKEHKNIDENQMKENLEKINKIQQIILNYDFHDVSPDEYKKYKSIILTRIQKLATLINYASVFSQLDQIVVEYTNTMRQPDIKTEEIADFLKNLIDGYIKEIIPDVVGLRKSSLSTIILKILGKKNGKYI